MKQGVLILILGLALGTVSFAGVYYLRTAGSRHLLNEPRPELAWLKKEFKLSDAEFARISQLHAGYLPGCAARCQRIEEQNTRLRELFTQSRELTPEIQRLLALRAQMRADCEAEMMKHFLAVSQTMPPDQGRRYLEWVEQQTFMGGHAMEQSHHAHHHE